MENSPQVNIENGHGIVGGNRDIRTDGGDFMVNSQKINTLYDPVAVWQRRYLALTPYAEPPYFGASRDAELDAVSQMLGGTDGRCLALVNGTGGIGKTSVAAAWCARRGEAFAHILWLHCGEGTVGEALLRCGLMERLFPPGAFLPGTPEEVRLDALLSALCSPPTPRSRCLLVLDNANRGDDLRASRHRLENLAAQGWAVLLTSRAEQTGLPERKIGVLPPPLARALFLDYFQPAEMEAEDLLGRLLVAIGYHTLLIEALAKHLAARRDKGKAALLATLCTQLERAGALALPATDTVDVHWQNRHGHTPEALLEALFDLSALDTAAQALLLRLALLSAEPMTLPHLYPLFGITVDGPEEAAFDVSLAALAHAGWLEWQAGVGYRVHPLIAAVVRQRLLAGHASCADLVERLIKIHGEAQLTQSLEYVEDTRALTGWLEEKNGLVARLNLHLADTMFNLGDYRNMEIVLQRAGEQFEAVEEWENAAVVLERLGRYFQTIGKIEDALQYFEKYLKLSEELYAANPRSESMKNGLAISYSKLGAIFQAQGKFEDALQYFEKDLKLTEELYAANPRSAELLKGLGVSQYKLGAISAALDRSTEAQARYRQALNIFQKLATMTGLLQHVELVTYMEGLLEK